MKHTQSFNLRTRMLGALMTILLATSSLAQTNSPAQAARTLSNQNLGGFMENMGYETEKAGEGVYRILIKRDEWNFRVNVGLSRDQQKLWLTSYLGEIPDLAKLPPGFQTKLLLANDEVGPASFFLHHPKDAQDKSGKKLYLGIALDNRALTPALIRQEIDDFCSTIKGTQALWDNAQWTVAVKSSAEQPKTSVK